MSDQSTPKQTRWGLADIIDYELLLEADTKADPTEQQQIAQRDSSIRQQLLEQLGEAERKSREHDSIQNRRWWLHQWVRIRSDSGKTEEPSIGEATVSGLGTLAWVFGFIGFVLGLISLFGLLAAPVVVQVPVVLLIYLGPQVLFVLIAVLIFMRQRISGYVHSPPVLQFLASRLLTPLVEKMASRSSDRLAGDDRTLQVRAALGLVLGRGRLHREALAWPLISAIQRMALSFSLAVAVGMLVIAQVSHFNFGWASTNNAINAELVHAVSKGMATPWARIHPEGQGFPTLEEIKRSQTFRSQPLPTDFPVLSSWWCFLVLSLFTYACVPRALLLGYSLHRQHRALACETFQDRRSDKLYRQLARPSLTHIAGDQGPASWDDDTGSNSNVIPGNNGGSKTMAPASACFVFTEMVLPAPDQQSVKERLAQRLGFVVFDFLQAYSPDQQEAARGKLKQTEWRDGIPRVVLLYRSSDPIVANVRYFCKACLDIIGGEGHLIVALVGGSRLLFEPADDEDVAVWREYLDTLKQGFPNAELEILTDSNS